ncbi:hypothetical protein AVEN_94857-1 [Araneus ventricosus]|uniref:Uncharacterized protein n=1 Tax=Araneus ventricosus TaxID=182803 RepID=A0A4Y2FLG4_ARAVE|nr:hypothetical protein AVEN_94857-1 [Araneus ventricosus]
MPVSCRVVVGLNLKTNFSPSMVSGSKNRHDNPDSNFSLQQSCTANLQAYSKGHKTTNDFAQPPGKRPHVELATSETIKKTRSLPPMFQPSANGQRKKKARLVVGSCGQKPDKSLRLKFSVTPHSGSAKEFIVGVSERRRDRWRSELEIRDSILEIGED